MIFIKLNNTNITLSNFVTSEDAAIKALHHTQYMQHVFIVLWKLVTMSEYKNLKANYSIAPLRFKGFFVKVKFHFTPFYFQKSLTTPFVHISTLLQGTWFVHDHNFNIFREELPSHTELRWTGKVKVIFSLDYYIPLVKAS